MKEFLELTVWFAISSRIHCDIRSAQETMMTMELLESKGLLDLNNYTEVIQQSYQFYITAKQYLICKEV